MYQKKEVSVEEALSHIRDGSKIITSLCAQAPFLLLKHLHEVADAGKNLKFTAI